MDYTLTCPDALLRQILRHASASANGSLLVECGLRSHENTQEWLVTARPRARSFRSGARGFLVRTAPLSPPELAEGFDGWLSIRDDGGTVRVSGEIREGGTRQQLHALKLIGPGMHSLLISSPAPRAPRVPFAGPDLEALALERWDRTIGAVGGTAEWGRLVSLRVGIAGCGRSGSIAALSLARLGVRELVLVDPDVVRLHNLGEMAGVTTADIGVSKVAAVAHAIRAELNGVSPAVMAIAEPVQSPLAMAALSGCDVLVSSPDNDAPRVALGILACLYHRVLIDVGSGVHGEPDTSVSSRDRVFGAHERRWHAAGADVRLIVPGEAGCLLCHAGLADPEGAIDAICNRRESMSRVLRPGQRLGSLMPLNQIAGGIAVQMLIDLVAGRVMCHTSARLDLGRDGRLRLDYLERSEAATPSGPCSLCDKAGLGDLAF